MINPHKWHSTFDPPDRNLEYPLIYPRHLLHLNGPRALGYSAPELAAAASTPSERS